MDTTLLDQETDAERVTRHRQELRAVVDREGLVSNHEALMALHEDQRREWLDHPTSDTLARRASERQLFNVKGSTSEDEGDDRPRRMRASQAPKGNVPATGVRPPSNDRRGGRR